MSWNDDWSSRVWCVRACVCVCVCVWSLWQWDVRFVHVCMFTSSCCGMHMLIKYACNGTGKCMHICACQLFEHGTHIQLHVHVFSILWMLYAYIHNYNCCDGHSMFACTILCECKSVCGDVGSGREVCKWSKNLKCKARNATLYFYCVPLVYYSIVLVS